MVTQCTEWEGQHTRLVQLGGLPSQPAGQLSRVTGVSVHQTLGTYHRGLDGVVALLDHWARPPALGPDLRPRGGGYGRPAPYHFVVTGPTPGPGGKLEVYRVASDTQDLRPSAWPLVRVPAGHVTVGVCGHYASRHGAQTRARLDPLVWLALDELVRDYLLPRYGLGPASLTGGWEQGSPADPGDALEQWVRHVRGEGVPDPQVELVSWPRVPVEWPDGYYQLPMPPERLSAALSGLGYRPGVPQRGWSDELTAALRAFQAHAGIPAHGGWDLVTETAVRRASA